MPIITFIQDAHSTKDVMKSQGIPDFFIRRNLDRVGQPPTPIPKCIDAAEAIEDLHSDFFSNQLLIDYKIRFLDDGTGGGYPIPYFLQLSAHQSVWNTTLEEANPNFGSKSNRSRELLIRSTTADQLLA